MPINSRAKGNRGELEFAKFVSKIGYASRRGRQFKGTPDSPDVQSIDIPVPVHWEVKRTEITKLYPFLEKATADAGDDQFAVVAHRKNRKPWTIIMDAEVWFNMLEAAEMLGYQEGLVEGKVDDER